MNAVTPTKPETEVGAEAPAIIERATALQVLTDPERFDDFYARVKAETDAHVPDVTTAKGRDAIKSLAFKVVKTKTAIDAAGKALTEEWRSQTAKVDASRKAIRDKLDALRDDVRRPLNEWEAAEEARVAECEAALARFKAATVVAIGETAAEVSGRLADIEAYTLDPKVFADLMPIAEVAVSHAKEVLSAAVARLIQEEADRAELERLRAAEQERIAREQAEREQRERQEREAAEARAQAEAEALRRQEAEERRAREAEEAAERERQAAARAAQEAEERARAEERQRAEAAAAEARRKADEERAAAEAVAAEERRQNEARLAEERRQREAAEAEARRLQHEQEAREREEADRRAADAARQADREHRGKIMGEAKAALMALGLKEEVAKKVVLAIAADEIPHVAIGF